MKKQWNLKLSSGAIDILLLAYNICNNLDQNQAQQKVGLIWLIKL